MNKLRLMTLTTTKDNITKSVTYNVDKILYITPANNNNAHRCILCMEDGSMHLIEQSYENVMTFLTNY